MKYMPRTLWTYYNFVQAFHKGRPCQQRLWASLIVASQERCLVHNRLIGHQTPLTNLSYLASDHYHVFTSFAFFMKYVALLSGGKDSCYNIVHCDKNGHQLIAAASLRPEQGKGFVKFSPRFSSLRTNRLQRKSIRIFIKPSGRMQLNLLPRPCKCLFIAELYQGVRSHKDRNMVGEGQKICLSFVATKRRICLIC